MAGTLALLVLAAAGAAAAPPALPPTVTWLSPSSPPINPSEPRGAISFPIYSDSMPLGNGALTVSAWANVSAGGISAYIGHQGAMSSHCELFKIALLTLSLSPSPFAQGEAYFSQSLEAATGTVVVLAGGSSAATAAAAIRIWVDANADQLLVDISSPSGAAFTLNATLASTRPATPVSYAMAFPMCSNVQSQPDVLVDPLPPPARLARPPPQSAAEAVRRPSAARAPSRLLPTLPPTAAFAPATLVIYHRNVPADWAGSPPRSEVNLTLTQQGLEDLIATTPDHWQDLQFGLALDGGGSGGGGAPLVRLSPSSLTSAAPGAAFTLRATVLALQTDTPAEWLAELAAAVAAAPAAPRPAHEAWWAAFWDRSYVQPTVPGDANLTAALQDKYALTRYVQAIQSRGSLWPIKFNGMAFMAHATGDSGSADYRIWGPSNWWQNTRLPYGTMLAAGDFEEHRVILDYYSNMAQFLQPRTQKYWNHSGLWTTETQHLTGAYQQFDYGCSRPAGYPVQYEASGYLHVDQGGNSGTGEFSLMALDFYASTGNPQYLPLAFGAAEYFMYHFLGNVSATGQVVIWPAQVLETYWCTYNLTTATWTNCCADDAPTISGMLTLFEKLRALPPALTTPAQRAAWDEFATVRMPSLPLTPNGTIAPARILSTGSHNGEGPTLYAMHPHRVFTKGREVATGRNLSLAVATYLATPWASYSNEGWNYGINAAVLAGMTEAAVPQLISRAYTYPAPGYRFPAFSPQWQDYDPSADHYANFMRALQEMVMQSGEDGFENATIVLLPTWPCQWEVAAKLWAPGNTSVEFAYANGTVTGLVVTPPQRAAAVKWAACVTA